MNFFSTKKRKVEELMDTYRSLVLQCVRDFHAMLKDYIHKGDKEALRMQIKHVSQLEGKADNIRRDLEVLMYKNALYPESRGDMLGLLESTDKLANSAESTAYMLQTHDLEIPSEFGEQVIALSECTRKCVETAIEAQERLFTNFATVLELVGRVHELESKADHIERELIENIFGSGEKTLHKLMLRDFVLRLSSIADRAENVADRMRITVARRGV